LQLNKRLNFQPSTGQSTTKNKKHSVVRTLERQLEGEDYVLGGAQELPARRGGLQYAAHSLEHSAERPRIPTDSVERGVQLIKDYSAAPTQVSLRQRHPSRGQSSNNDSSVGVYSGGAGLIYNISTSPMFVHDNAAAIQQYSSIPVAKAFTSASLKRQSAMASAGTSSLEMNKQASALMKMYGNTGNVYRKQQLKSVDKKAHPIVAAAGYTTNY